MALTIAFSAPTELLAWRSRPPRGARRAWVGLDDKEMLHLIDRLDEPISAGPRWRSWITSESDRRRLSGNAETLAELLARFAHRLPEKPWVFLQGVTPLEVATAFEPLAHIEEVVAESAWIRQTGLSGQRFLYPEYGISRTPGRVVLYQCQADDDLDREALFRLGDLYEVDNAEDRHFDRFPTERQALIALEPYLLHAHMVNGRLTQRRTGDPERDDPITQAWWSAGDGLDPP